MGNCLFGGMGDLVDDGVIKVITSNGGIMEFNAPITVESIINEYPNHNLFRSHDLFWNPLSHRQHLISGQSYYLIPSAKNPVEEENSENQRVREGHVRSNSIPNSAVVAPYRMSFDYQRKLKRSYTEVFSRYYNSNGNGNDDGVWKVKLVISPKQLLEILEKEGRTEELIQSVRTVAKCGGSNGFGFSDHWSLSSFGSRNASSSINHALLDI